MAAEELMAAFLIVGFIAFMGNYLLSLKEQKGGKK